MATAAVDETCVCGANFAMSYDAEGSDPPVVVLEAVREWRAAHAAHGPEVAPVKKEFGFLGLRDRELEVEQFSGLWSGANDPGQQEDDDD